MPRRARWYIGRRPTSSPSKMTRPPSRRDHADGHLETGGLAGPVLAEEADDLGLIDGEGDVVNDLAAAVDLHKAGNVKEFQIRLSPFHALVGDIIRQMAGNARAAPPPAPPERPGQRTNRHPVGSGTAGTP